MRSQSALFVDAGYLLAAAATRLTGSSLRDGLTVDYPGLLEHLATIVEQASGIPVMRVYWYDAAREGARNPAHKEIATLPRVKLRLGRIGLNNEQKGVDIRIGLDMVGHSRGDTVDVMYLLSGDDDLTEAVEEAQSQGVQVNLLVMPSKSGGYLAVSRHLVAAADDVEVIDGDALDGFIAALASAPERPKPASDAAVAARPGTPKTLPRSKPAVPRPPAETEPQEASSPDSPSALDASLVSAVAKKTYDVWAASATSAQISQLETARPTILPDVDRALLQDYSSAVELSALDEDHRRGIRKAFWDAVDAMKERPV